MIFNKKFFVILAIVGPFVIFISLVFETETLKDIDMKGNFKKKEDSSKIQNFTSEKAGDSLKIEKFNREDFEFETTLRQG